MENRIAAIESCFNGAAGTSLERYRLTDGTIGWRLGVGAYRMPKLYLEGVDINDVLTQAETLHGITHASNAAIVPGVAKTFPYTNARGNIITGGQIWHDCDPRRANRYACVVGADEYRAIMIECDEHGTLLDNSDRRVWINLERMYKHAAGWELHKDTP